MSEMTTGSPEFAQATLRRVSFRILPYIVIAYILNFIDRVNLGFAALQMNTELAFTATVFGYGAGILFVGYFVFGVPSNLLLHRIGARRLISSLLTAWGLVSTSMIFVTNEWSFYVIRFLLGATEAGFFPGVLLYLSYWYPKQRLGRITSQFMFATPCSLMLGSVLSGYLLGMDGVAGLSGWKWMFIVEGLPATLCGLIGFFYLTDKPKDAKWLTEEQKTWLQGVIDEETRLAKIAGGQQGKQEGFLSAITHPRVIAMCLIYVCFTTSIYGVNMWLPQILKSFGDLSTTTIGYLSATPFLAASVGMLIVGWSSDHFKERKWHVTICAFMAGFAILLSSFTGFSLALTVFLISIASIGSYSQLPIFWTIPPTFLTGSSRAAGIGAINAVGNLGGLITPIMIGVIKDATGGFRGGLLYMAVVAMFGSVCIFIVARKAQSNVI